MGCWGLEEGGGGGGRKKKDEGKKRDREKAVGSGFGREGITTGAMGSSHSGTKSGTNLFLRTTSPPVLFMCSFPPPSILPSSVIYGYQSWVQGSACNRCRSASAPASAPAAASWAARTAHAAAPEATGPEIHLLQLGGSCPSCTTSPSPGECGLALHCIALPRPALVPVGPAIPGSCSSSSSQPAASSQPASQPLFNAAAVSCAISIPSHPIPPIPCQARASLSSPAYPAPPCPTTLCAHHHQPVLLASDTWASSLPNCPVLLPDPTLSCLPWNSGTTSVTFL